MAKHHFTLSAIVLVLSGVLGGGANAQSIEAPEPFGNGCPPRCGVVQPRHVTHPAPAHRIPALTSVHPDRSADALNAKELAAIQHGSSAPATTPPAPAETP
jgi:hypothetical protein